MTDVATGAANPPEGPSEPGATERLTLRLIDAPRAERIVARAPAAEDDWAEGYPTGGDVEASGSFLREHRRGNDPAEFGVYEIVENATGTVVGGIGFHHAPDDSGTVEVGYGLVASRWNRGYATEALIAMIALAKVNHARRVQGRALADNAASRRVMEKAGMVFDVVVGGYARYVVELP